MTLQEIDREIEVLNISLIDYKRLIDYMNSLPHLYDSEYEEIVKLEIKRYQRIVNYIMADLQQLELLKREESLLS